MQWRMVEDREGPGGVASLLRQCRRYGLERMGFLFRGVPILVWLSLALNSGTPSPLRPLPMVFTSVTKSGLVLSCVNPPLLENSEGRRRKQCELPPSSKRKLGRLGGQRGP